jgi:hypothetical protein
MSTVPVFAQRRDSRQVNYAACPHTSLETLGVTSPRNRVVCGGGVRHPDRPICSSRPKAGALNGRVVGHHAVYAQPRLWVGVAWRRREDGDQTPPSAALRRPAGRSSPAVRVASVFKISSQRMLRVLRF